MTMYSGNTTTNHCISWEKCIIENGTEKIIALCAGMTEQEQNQYILKYNGRIAYYDMDRQILHT